MNYVVADGKSNWMEGLILVCESFAMETSDFLLIDIWVLGLYVIIAISFWFYPGSNMASALATCTLKD